MRRISFANQLVLLWALIAVVCTLLAGVIWLLFQTDQSRQISVASMWRHVTLCLASPPTVLTMPT
jgi:hypothetical protein